MARLLLVFAVLGGCVPRPAIVAPVPTPVVKTAPPAAATEPADVVDTCSKVPCRFVKAVGQRMPYVFEGDVVIAAGESFAFTGTNRDDLLVDLRLVDAKTSASKVVVSWKQRPDGRVGLSVQNGLGRRLRYRAMLLTPADTEFIDADSCSVGPGNLDTSAAWPGPVSLIALTSLELVGAQAFDACEKR